MKNSAKHALGRDEKNRYTRARDFAWDLRHLDQVGVEERPEMRNWRRRKQHLPRRVLYYSALALIPVVILGLMVLLAHRR